MQQVHPQSLCKDCLHMLEWLDLLQHTLQSQHLATPENCTWCLAQFYGLLISGLTQHLFCRRYALLLRRFLQSKLQCGLTHHSPSIKYTSSAEVAVPYLTETFDCKANATTDFRQRLLLHGELQWHAKRRQAKTTSPDTTKGSKVTGPKWHSNIHSNSGQQMQICQATWYSSSAAHLPWHGQGIQYPSPVFAHKARLANYRNATGTGIKGFEADKDLESTDESQAGRGPGDQCTFQLKGSAEGKPPPTWQIRGSKALGAKLQLRAQASAALGMAQLLPSRWQLEMKHKLRKGAMLNIKLQRDERRSPQQFNRHKAQIERRARSHWMTCMCAQEASGEQYTCLHRGPCAEGVISISLVNPASTGSYATADCKC